MYQYKSVHVPYLAAGDLKEAGEQASTLIESRANKMAKAGWEFYRIDTVGTFINPGCLAGLLGARTIPAQVYVMIFRREGDHKG